MGDERLEVVIDKGATRGEIAGVEEAFREIGLEVDVQPVMEARGAAEVPWVVLVAGAAGVAVLNQLLQRSTDDSYDALKRWVGGIREARRRERQARRGSIDLRGTELAILFPDDVSDEGLRALLELDLTSYPSGTLLVWDSREERWVES